LIVLNFDDFRVFTFGDLGVLLWMNFDDFGILNFEDLYPS